MKRTATKVLEVLYDRGDAFVPLDELSTACGLRGERLAEALEALGAAGQSLEVSPAHGVRLARPVHLDAHLIERDLGVARVGRNVICFDEVTNVKLLFAPPGEIGRASCRERVSTLV
jgi:biotin operon repressor